MKKWVNIESCIWIILFLLLLIFVQQPWLQAVGITVLFIEKFFFYVYVVKKNNPEAKTMREVLAVMYPKKSRLIIMLVLLVVLYVIIFCGIFVMEPAAAV